jgi:uncharacterized protein YegJ (DUF2314 family)
MPPHDLIDWDAQLINDEKDEIKACGTAVSLHLKSDRNHILRDRKNLVFYLHAVLGEEGVAALDHVSQKFWSRGALELETLHGADLDVDGLITFHAVADEAGRVNWLHSHGLGEIGCFDFDIIRPGDELRGEAYDVLRAIAFAIVEGQVKEGGTFTPLGNGVIRAVPAAEYMKSASEADRAPRGDSKDHDEKRVVLCEGEGGVVSRLFRSRPHPARILSTGFDERYLIHFSKAATELMAERARATFELFTRLNAELAEFNFPSVVKLGYQVDGGKEDDREHLWFEFHGVNGDVLEATLANEPFRISGMKAGQRGLHSIDRLTDWAIMTPAGTISPRSTKPLRFIRRHSEELREALRRNEAEPAENS